MTSQSPRRLRAKYTHRTNCVCTQGISPCWELIADNGIGFVDGHPMVSTHKKQKQEEVAYCKEIHL